MKTRAFSFKLPAELIAQEPPTQRGASRLLVLDRERGTIRHVRIAELPSFLLPGTVVVLNDSRVRKARLGALETLLHEGYCNSLVQSGALKRV